MGERTPRGRARCMAKGPEGRDPASYRRRGGRESTRRTRLGPPSGITPATARPPRMILTRAFVATPPKFPVVPGAGTPRRQTSTWSGPSRRGGGGVPRHGSPPGRRSTRSKSGQGRVTSRLWLNPSDRLGLLDAFQVPADQEEVIGAERAEDAGIGGRPVDPVVADPRQGHLPAIGAGARRPVILDDLRERPGFESLEEGRMGETWAGSSIVSWADRSAPRIGRTPVRPMRRTIAPELWPIRWVRAGSIPARQSARARQCPCRTAASVLVEARRPSTVAAFPVPAPGRFIGGPPRRATDSPTRWAMVK